jgi:hypothetical protein
MLILGWDARAYERTLERAGWEYIVQQGSLHDGAYADGNIFAKTLAKFPDIAHQHIVIAIEHAHKRGFDRPLGDRLRR